MNYILSSFYILIFWIGASLTAQASLGFSAVPRLVSQSSSTLSFEWETTQESRGYYRYSPYPAVINQASELKGFTEGLQSSFQISLKNLNSHSFYYFQAINIVGRDTLYGEIELYSPVSQSTHEIQLYFNSSIDESKSRGTVPNGTTTGELEQAIIDKINAASISIDYCIYNTHRRSIVDAIADAANRGVQVRVIHNDKRESSNIGFDRSLPFNVVERLGDGLMHNKFLIIDADEVDRSWVMSGSTNFTDLQMDVDPNHIIFIQDQNLAKAYEIEFEEMWGSDGPSPDASKARFGINKADNTPHEFMINGRIIELYFSPSDKVSQKINDAITAATSTIDAALLIFTKWETRDALEDEIATGTKFRAIIEDIENSNEIISRLEDKGAKISDHPQDAQIHHKYAIIDEGLQDARSKVITGSHNWTHSADIRHDENLLIIHDAEIANWFQQEWEARWAEQTTAVIDLEKAKQLITYPNPANDFLMVLTDNSVTEYKIFDIRGALRKSISNDPSRKEQLLDITNLESGSYLVVGLGERGEKTLNTIIKL